MGSSVLSVSGNLKPRWVKQEAFPVVQSRGMLRGSKWSVVHNSMPLFGNICQWLRHDMYS